MSRFPLVKVADKYSQMTQDSRLLSNRASIEVIRNRIMQLAERIDVQDAPDRLAHLYELWLEFEIAYAEDKRSEMAILMRKIHTLFEAATNDYAAWRQIFEAIDLDRKLVESEVKVLKAIRAILTAEDAYELVAKMLSIITRYVTDKKTLKAIQYEFTKLVGDRPSDYPSRAEDVVELDEEDLEEMEL